MSNDPVLTSDTLTSLKDNRTKQRASAAHWRGETWRLTKMQSPVSCYDETSETTWDPDTTTVARIGLLKTTMKKESASAGDGNEAARREDAIKKTLAGETLVTPVSIQQELDAAKLHWTAAEDACEYLEKEIRKEKTALAIEYSKKIKPKHDAIMGRVCKTLLEAHAAWSELYDLKRHLIDSEVGLRGLCLTTPDFLGPPNSPHSEFAEFLRSAKIDGFISAVPKEMKL